MKKIAYVLIGVFLLSLFAIAPTTMAQEEKPVFKYGYGSGDADTLDPADAWDSGSIDILDQVLEGLVGYDLYDPSLAIVPLLATDLGTWNADATNVTFTLRQGVTFHDGSKFNATAVNYTFARLNHMIDTWVGVPYAKGSYPLSQLGELYKPLEAIHPATPFVIKEIVINSEYSVTFVLNYPYIAFTPLLCFSGSYIVHKSMPYNDSIGLTVEPLGTGPYVLESYENEEQHFVAYSGYWRAQPQIQEMRWIRFADSVALAQGFLGGDVDRPESAHPDFIEQYEAAPSIYVDPPMKGTCINYLGMNMQDINLTFRKAISYGINYDYICTDVMNNQAMRSISPIPDGIMYHDPTATPFPYNVTLGRKVLIDAGLTTLTLASSSTAWSNLVGSAPIATFNYTYNIGNRIRGDIGLLIQTNLAQLGIKVVLEGVSWPQFLDALYVYPDRLQLFQVGWCADYNDPSNYINPLFSNTSYGNSAQVNDPWLQDKMMEALSETNATARKALYYEMQEYLTEDLIPWCYLFVGISKAAWSVHLTEVPRNAMGKLYFYPCHWYEETTTTGGIPGFSFIALLGAAAVTIGVLLYKRRR